MSIAGLPEMEPAEAQWRTDLMAALNGQVVDRMIVRAAIVKPDPPALMWFTCVGRCAFAFETCAGTRPLLTTEDSTAAIALLEAPEPLLRLVEYALGIELEPDGLRPETESDWALVRIDGLDGERLVHRLYLSLPRQSPITPQDAPFAPELLGDVPVPAHLMVVGPRIAPHDAADLSEGDLLLLGPGPLHAALHALDGPQVQGWLDPGARHFTSNQETGNSR